MHAISLDFQPYTFFNQPGERTLDIEVISDKLMPPSFSSRILIENMSIAQGESVLDLGAGTGIIGIAAKILGASNVTMVDIENDADKIMRANIIRNHNDVSTFDVLIGDLFAPLGYRRFDHILVNPPSIPSLGEDLPLCYRAGPDGRLLHDPIQFLARYYLRHNGRLTFVQGSISNVDITLSNLDGLGFKCQVAGPFEMPFADFFPLEYIRSLADEGHARYCMRDGHPYDKRYVITATIEDEYHSPVMHVLKSRGINFRMLPHKKIAKTVTLAAAERGVAIGEMVKCILLKDKNNHFVLACLTGEADLDVQRVREYVQGYGRLSFASPEEIKNVTGYELGSVAPFSLRNTIPIVLDEAIENNDRLNISSGDPRLGLELSRTDLIRCLGDHARFGSIRKDASKS